MKSKLILFCFVLAACSCKKGNTTVTPDPLIGKWQITSIHIREQINTGAKEDTTFSGTAITALDYLQINPDRTAVLSTSGAFSTTGKATAYSNGHLVISTLHYSYIHSSDSLILKLTDLTPNPSGIQTSNIRSGFSILKLDSKTLVLNQQPSYSGPESISIDSYYTRVK